MPRVQVKIGRRRKQKRFGGGRNDTWNVKYLSLIYIIQKPIRMHWISFHSLRLEQNEKKKKNREDISSERREYWIVDLFSWNRKQKRMPIFSATLSSISFLSLSPSQSQPDPSFSFPKCPHSHRLTVKTTPWHWQHHTPKIFVSGNSTQIDQSPDAAGILQRPSAPDSQHAIRQSRVCSVFL